MNSPFPTPDASGGQPQYPGQQYPGQQYPGQQQPYPQQYPPQQPYAQQYPGQQQYPQYYQQPGGYPPQNYPQGYPYGQYPGMGRPSAVPAYIVGGLLCLFGLGAGYVGISFLPVLIPAVLTLAGGILFLVRLWFAPVVAIAGGASSVILFAVATAVTGEAVEWQPLVIFAGYAVVVIVPCVLPPVWRAARRTPRPQQPPYQPY